MKIIINFLKGII
ncbi:hypothetical protein ACTFIW_009058 [Dictyostelium discoideum]